MARSLAQNGATVYVLGRRLAKLEEVAASSSQGSAPGKILPLECDVVSKPSLKAAAARITAETGFVNLVVANAGVIGPKNDALKPRAADDPQGPVTLLEAQKHLWQMSTDAFLDAFRVNVAGALDTAVAFLELLDAGNTKGNVPQTSQILVTSSIAGFHRSFTANGLAYTTSKAAVNHLTKSLASFLAPYRIRVNGLAPGRECCRWCPPSFSILVFSVPLKRGSAFVIRALNVRSRSLSIRDEWTHLRDRRTGRRLDAHQQGPARARGTGGRGRGHRAVPRVQSRRVLLGQHSSCRWGAPGATSGSNVLIAQGQPEDPSRLPKGFALS